VLLLLRVSKQAWQYSCVIKQRLSVAISFFMDPLVHLDAPSMVSGLCIVGRSMLLLA
jgi:hypothetical protein